MSKPRLKVVRADTIKITNKTLLKSIGALQEISRLALRPKMSYAISKTVWELQHHLELYNAESNKILERSVKRNEKNERVAAEGGGFQLLDPVKYGADIDELLAVEIEVKVKKIDLGMLGENKITVGTLTDLAWLIEDTSE